MSMKAMKVMKTKKNLEVYMLREKINSRYFAKRL